MRERAERELIQFILGQTSVQSAVDERFFPGGFEANPLQVLTFSTIDESRRALTALFEEIAQARVEIVQIGLFAQADAIRRITHNDRGVDPTNLKGIALLDRDGRVSGKSGDIDPGSVDGLGVNIAAGDETPRRRTQRRPPVFLHLPPEPGVKVGQGLKPEPPTKQPRRHL